MSIPPASAGLTFLGSVERCHFSDARRRVSRDISASPRLRVNQKIYSAGSVASLGLGNLENSARSSGPKAQRHSTNQ